MNTRFECDILENTLEGVVKVGTKVVYNLDDGVKGCHTLYENNLKTKTLKPVLSSSLNIKDKLIIDKDFEIGIYYAKGLTVNKNATEVAMFSTTFSDFGSNKSVNKQNFLQTIAGFCARRLIKSNVWNDKDEYMKPSDDVLNSDEYKQWNNNCIVYALFDNQSFQSSLRDVEYQGKEWNIYNEFFWQSKQFMSDIANKKRIIPIIDDIDEHANKERHLYTVLQPIRTTLCKEATDVLDYADYLLELTIEARNRMIRTNPDYHLQSWDAGYTQLKLVTKEYYKEEHKKFRELVDTLANYLKPYVYKFGFLYE